MRIAYGFLKLRAVEFFQEANRLLESLRCRHAIRMFTDETLEHRGFLSRI